MIDPAGDWVVVRFVSRSAGTEVERWEVVRAGRDAPVAIGNWIVCFSGDVVDVGGDHMIRGRNILGRERNT